MSNIATERRRSSATCPRCRPGRVWSYSWRPVGCTTWIAALWCEASPACLPRIVLSEGVRATRDAAEQEALRLWSERAIEVFEPQVGGAA